MAMHLLQRKSDYLHSGSINNPKLCHADLSDQIEVWNPKFGQGYQQMIPLQDDLSLIILDDKLHSPLLINQPVQIESSLKFEFQLVGNKPQQSNFTPQIAPASLDMRHGQQRKFKLEVSFGPSALMAYYRRTAERLSPQALESCNQFIEISHYGFFGCHATSSQKALDQILHRSSISPPPMEKITQIICSTPEFLGTRLTTERTMTPAMNQIIHQILGCPYGGRSRRTYLEKKALELVDLKLNQLEQWSAPSYPLRFEELDNIREASAILARQLQTPPSVEKLAQLVGLNRFKLNHGFHHIFGTTPFRYLRTCRLELASHLLLTSRETIDMIAYRVGYNNRSRFAAAFRREFGMNPKVFQIQMSTWDHVLCDRRYAS